MSEDSLLRFISLAVVIFLFVITLSVIMLYYNTAIRASEAVMDTTVDFGAAYDEELKDYVGKTIQGTELLSLIRNIPLEKEVRLSNVSLGLIDFYVPRVANDNVREGDLTIIKKADTYHISTINITDTRVDISFN